MQDAEQDDQEDHLEEGDKEVAGGECQAKDTQDGRARALQDGDAQGVETLLDPLVWRLVLLDQVVVADMGREVDREANAHDEVDQGHAIQVDTPPGHVADHTNLNGDDGQGHPERADKGRDEDQGDDDHDQGRDQDALNGLWPDGQVLVNVDEKRLKNGDFQVICRKPVTRLSQVCHHLLLQVRVDNVMTLQVGG